MLDCDGTAEITGGTLLAAGAMGMNQNFGGSSTQCSILVDLSAGQAAGTQVTLADNAGEVLAEFVPEKAFQTLLISSPDLQVGQVYTITTGTETVTVELMDTSTVRAAALAAAGAGCSNNVLGESI